MNRCASALARYAPELPSPRGQRRAREDLALQFDWYWREAGEEVAERYLAAFRQTLDLIGQQREMGVRRRFRSPRLCGIRSFQMVKAFRVHTIFYRIEADALTVFRELNDDSSE